MITCPVCLGELLLQSEGDLDTWRCGRKCGFAITLSEMHSDLRKPGSQPHMQEDDIETIWHEALGGEPGPLKAPSSERKMVRVTVDVDDDEATTGQVGDGLNRRALTLDVDLFDQFIWFDAGEWEQMPTDIPNPDMSLAQYEKLDEIVKRFGDSLSEAWHQEDHDQPIEHFADDADPNQAIGRSIQGFNRSVLKLLGRDYPEGI